MGTGGVMYNSGNIVSGPQDSLVDLLLPNNIEDLDKVWSFILSLVYVSTDVFSFTGVYIFFSSIITTFYTTV